MYVVVGRGRENWGVEWGKRITQQVTLAGFVVRRYIDG